MVEKTAKYELVLIIKSTLPDNDRKSFITDLESEIKALDGTIIEENVWGKRHLSTLIKKEKEGYYVVMNIEIDPKKADELSRSLKIKNNLLRYLIRKVKAFEKILQPSEKFNKDK